MTWEHGGGWREKGWCGRVKEHIRKGFAKKKTTDVTRNSYDNDSGVTPDRPKKKKKENKGTGERGGMTIEGKRKNWRELRSMGTTSNHSNTSGVERGEKSKAKKTGPNFQ